MELGLKCVKPTYFRTSPIVFLQLTHLSLNLCNTIKQFHVTGLFLYPLKTPENQRFSNISRRYRKRKVARNELTTNNDQNSNQFITFFHLIQIQSIRKEKTNLSKLT